MNKQAIGIGKLLVIAGFALSCFGLLLFLWLAFGGEIPLKPKGYRFKVAFPDAVGLATQADVRVAGVNVGKVVSETRDPRGNRMLVTIQLDSQYAPLRADARAILRQKTLLGEGYVALSFGDRHARAIPEGGRLADGQVEREVRFDDLLRIFDRPTRLALQQWQQSTARGLGGHGEDLSDAIGNLAPFIENAQGVSEVLDARRDALGSLVRGTESTFAAINRNEGALQDLVVRDARVFATLSDHRDALAASIRALPTFLVESRRTLRRISRFARTTDPLILDLRPVLRDTTPTLAALRTLSPDLRHLFGQLPPLDAAARPGLPALSSVLRALDPTLASLGPFLQQLNPILQYLELNQSVIGDFLSNPPGALALKLPTPPGTGSNGHVLPQLAVLGDQSLPAATRTSDNRGNTYFAPGALADPRLKDPQNFTFGSWDCNNVGGRQVRTGSQQACYLANPIPFQGRSQRFPQVRPAGPGGK